MKYYLRAFKNYFNIDGRASRREIWWFIFFHSIVVVVLSFIDDLFGFYISSYIPYGYISLFYLLASICPSICLQIRRLHDVGKSGNWWWIKGIPILSLYYFYLLCCKAGDSRPNYYGVQANSAQKVEPYKSKFTECPKCGYIAVFEKKCPKCDFILPTEAQNDNDLETPKILFCRKCGAKLLEGVNFCKECGTEIITKVEGTTNAL